MKVLSLTFALTLSSLLLSCESERTYYDLNGTEVEQREAGESLTLEDRFTKTFDTKKTAAGVTEASSNKVSSFQGKIDDTRKDNDLFSGRSYGTNQAEGLRDKAYAGASNRFAGSRAYQDGSRSAFTPDRVPDFMKPGKGIARKDYGEMEDSFLSGKRFHGYSGEYATKMSPTSRDEESGYFESRRDHTPPPAIMSRDEYVRKTLEETRNILGRDKDKL